MNNPFQLSRMITSKIYLIRNTCCLAAAVTALTSYGSITTVSILPHEPSTAVSNIFTEKVDNIENGDTLTAKGKGHIIQRDTTANMLPETTVEAKNYLHTPGKSVYTPSKSEKNTSIDPLTLLRRMNIPQLVTSASGGFTASDGAPISYFINGMPASQEELAGMNMSDVKKVEYLDFPREVNFMSAPHAVNFIVQKYVSGGYTRAGLKHFYLGGYSLEENLFSRWSYKRMTYDLSLSPQNTEADPTYATTTEVFRFGTGIVERYRKPQTGSYRFGYYPAKFRALYSHGATFISNSVGYSYNDRMHSLSEGAISYSGYPEAGKSFRRESPSKRSSLNWDGSGVFGLGNGWSLSALGNLYYTHYVIRNRYTLFSDKDFSGTPVSDIKNYINENSIDGKLQFVGSKQLSPMHSFNMTVSGSIHDSRMRYLETGQKSHFESSTFAFKGGYSLSLRKIYLNTTFGVAHEHTSMDGLDVNTLYPFGTLSLNYAINPTNNLSLWMQYSTFSPMISAKNPVTVQRDELMYTVGNPKVKPFPRYELSLNYLLQLGAFRIFSMFHWNHAFDAFHTFYTPMPGRQAMLQSFENGGHTDDVSLRVNLSLYLFNNKILVTATPEYGLQRSSYPGYPTLHPFEIYSTINGYFGNFNISANFYSGKSRRYSSQNMDVIADRPHSYWLKAGWGNGKVRAELTLQNIFTRKTDSKRSIVVSPYFDSTTIETSPYNCRQIIVNLSYTIGYGKKVDRSNEISGGVSNSVSGVNL